MTLNYSISIDLDTEASVIEKYISKIPVFDILMKFYGQENWAHFTDERKVSIASFNNYKDVEVGRNIEHKNRMSCPETVIFMNSIIKGYEKMDFLLVCSDEKKYHLPCGECRDEIENLDYNLDIILVYYEKATNTFHLRLISNQDLKLNISFGLI